MVRETFNMRSWARADNPNRALEPVEILRRLPFLPECDLAGMGEEFLLAAAGDFLKHGGSPWIVDSDTIR